MAPDSFQDISYEKDENGIVTVLLNTPARKNAMSMATFVELVHAVDNLEQDDTAYAMIITGAKDPNNDDPSREAFSSGGYFHPKAMEGVSDEVKAEIDPTDIAQKRLTLKMWQCDKPIIGAINGLAIGAGVTMPLSGCDLIYASEHAWFQFPFVQLGIVPELAYTYLMPRMVGYQKAAEIAFFGERIPAQEAAEIGFVNKVVPHSELLTFAKAQAARLCPPNAPGLAVKLAKKAMHEPYIEALEKALKLENDGLLASVVSHDFQESTKAKIEGRKPEYKGK